MNSYELVVFTGAKGAGSGEGEVKGESKVIGVGALFIVSCFPYVLASGLLPPSDVIPHGEEAWQVIFHMFYFQIVGPCQSMTLCIKLCTFLMHLRCISEALLHTLMHCVLDSACYATLHHPLHPCLCLFVCLFTFVTGACVACFVCLFPLPDWFC